MENIPSKQSLWQEDPCSWLCGQRRDNSQQIERLRLGLRLARENVLTQRQMQMITLYFDAGMSMRAIARLLEISPSTVSRTIARAQERLRRSLQYGLLTGEED